MSKIRSLYFLAPACLAASLLSDPLMTDNRIDTQRPDAPEMAAYGNYEVGTRPLTLTNPNQLDVLSLDSQADQPEPLPTYDRSLTVQMWYPSFPGASGSKAVRAFLRDATTEVSLYNMIRFIIAVPLSLK